MPQSQFGADKSLLRRKKSLFGGVGIFAWKHLKTKGNFGAKIVPNGHLPVNSL
jgi:hypothetical protein